MHYMIQLTALSMLGFGIFGAASAKGDDVNDIIRSLAPIAGQTEGGYHDRGILTEAARPPSEVRFEVIVENVVVVVDPTHAIDIEVYFPFDSATLTPEAQRALHALGQALQSPDLRPFSYLIAGHTDAKGAAAYNQALSERRAASVRAFLIEEYAIAPDRLLSIGFGEERLKAPHDPYAAVNRRVEILLIQQ